MDKQVYYDEMCYVLISKNDKNNNNICETGLNVVDNGEEGDEGIQICKKKDIVDEIISWPRVYWFRIAAIPRDANVVFAKYGRVVCDKLFLSEKKSIIDNLEILIKEICDDDDEKMQKMWNKIIQKIPAWSIIAPHTKKSSACDTTLSMQKLWTDFFNHDPIVYSVMPEEYVTYEMYLHLVQEIPAWITGIPKSKITEELWFHAIQSWCRDPHHFEELFIMQENDVTDELRSVVIKHYPRLLHLLPKNAITNEMWKEAFDNDNTILSNIPQDVMTYDMCTTLIENTPALFKMKKNDIGRFFENIPERIIDQNLCILIAESMFSYCFKFMKFSQKNEMIQNAWIVLFFNNPKQIVRIPDEMITEDMRRHIMNKHPELIQHIQKTQEDKMWNFNIVPTEPKSYDNRSICSIFKSKK